MLTFAVHAPPLGLLPVPVLSSEKLALEQHSFAFPDFCYPRPPHLGLLLVPVLVLEQHSFAFADFCCPRPPLGLLPVAVLSSEKLVLEQHSFTFADFCCPRLPPPVPVLSSDPSLLLTFAVRAPLPGAAAGARAEFREASFGATLFHFC